MRRLWLVWTSGQSKEWKYSLWLTNELLWSLVRMFRKWKKEIVEMIKSRTELSAMTIFELLNQVTEWMQMN